VRDTRRGQRNFVGLSREAHASLSLSRFGSTAGRTQKVAPSIRGEQGVGMSGCVVVNLLCLSCVCPGERAGHACVAPGTHFVCRSKGGGVGGLCVEASVRLRSKGIASSCWCELPPFFSFRAANAGVVVDTEER
jgi:hypothetical protein